MAQHATVTLDTLDQGLVLAPERYDPRRRPQSTGEAVLRDIAGVMREIVAPKKADPNRRYLVLDTGHAKEGIVNVDRPTMRANEIGSSKKKAGPGDVIISRLRPYLRQVAYVDQGVIDVHGKNTVLLCSTEFFVLRSPDERSIAFLVPYLLTAEVQAILSAAQEGGHHPRFSQTTLEALPVPVKLLEARDDVSALVQAAAKHARQAQVDIQSLVSRLEGQVPRQ